MAREPKGVAGSRWVVAAVRAGRGAAGGVGLWKHQPNNSPHLPLLLVAPPGWAGARSWRPPAGGGPGHPHHSGVTGPQRREDHHDLHARAQPRPARGAQPCRSCVAPRTCGSRTRKPRVLLGLAYLKPYAGTGFSRRARAPLGVVCGKHRGREGWFSEPPNKELGWPACPGLRLSYPLI